MKGCGGIFLKALCFVAAVTDVVDGGDGAKTSTAVDLANGSARPCSWLSPPDL